MLYHKRYNHIITFTLDYGQADELIDVNDQKTG